MAKQNGTTNQINKKPFIIAYSLAYTKPNFSSFQNQTSQKNILTPLFTKLLEPSVTQKALDHARNRDGEAPSLPFPWLTSLNTEITSCFSLFPVCLPLDLPVFVLSFSCRPALHVFTSHKRRICE